MKIVFLQNSTRTKQMFTEHTMQKLKALGETTVRNTTQDATVDEVKALLVDADIAVTSWGCPQLTPDLVSNSPHLGLVVHAGGSVKAVFAQELFSQGIRVANSARVLGKGVAETALGYTIASLKNLWQVSHDIADGGWNEHFAQVRELFEIKIGVIGAGFAGSHYIKLLQSFDVEVLLYDPFVDEATAHAMGAQKLSLEELLKRADVVSIHAPSIPQTNHMFCNETLELMKKNAILINTARGSLINEQDLFQQMSMGRLQYACIDVTDPEPPAKDHPLRSLPNVIFSPHLAGLTNNGLGRIGKNVLMQIEAYLQGRIVEDEVTADMLSRMA